MLLEFDTRFRDAYDVEGKYKELRGKRRYRLALYETMAWDWVKRELCCPRCGAQKLGRNEQWSENPRRFVNMTCQACGSGLHFVASYTNLRGYVQVNSYKTLCELIEAGEMPNLVCLAYDRDRFAVKDLFVVPGENITREYLSPGAIRGEPKDRDIWCNIMLGLLVHEQGEEAIIDIVRDGRVVEK